MGYDLLDIEFLKSERSSFKDCIVYEYNTGVFKQDVVSRISSIFDFRGFDIQEINYDAFNSSSRGSSLFGDLVFFVDVNKLVERNSNYKKDITTLIKDISNKEVSNKFVFLLKDSPEVVELKTGELFTKFTESTYNINEVELSKTTVNKVVDYLVSKDKVKMGDILNEDDLVNVVVQSMELVNNSLVDFVKMYERILYFCVENSSFDISKFNSLGLNSLNKEEYVLYKVISDFIVEPSSRTRLKLFKAVCDLCFNKKYLNRLILYRIIKVVRELSYINKHLGVSEEFISSLTKQKRYFLERFNSIPLKNLLKFSLKLVRWEQKLNSRNFIFEFNCFLIDMVG